MYYCSLTLSTNTTKNDLHCCNGGRGPSEIYQPALQNCLRREDSEEIYVDNEMFPNQINILSDQKNAYSVSRSTMIPKLSS